MNRSELRALTEKHGAQTGAALRDYFATEEGRIAIHNAPPVQAGGLPRPMTVDEAVAACLEEAATFRKPEPFKHVTRRAAPAPKRKK